MANTRIQIKRSLVTSTPTSLSPGELAYSYASNTLFIGTTGGGPIAIGGTSIADIALATAANTASTIVKRDANGAFYGRLYGNSNTATALETGRNFSIGGEVIASAVSFDGTGAVALSANLSTVTTAGTFGSGTAVPTITVAANGRVTSITTNPISTSFTLNGDSGTSEVSGGDTLTVIGGEGITSNVGLDNVTLSVDNTVVRANTSGGEQIINTSLRIAADKDLVVTGNLTVLGNSTVIETSTLRLEDSLIFLAGNNYTSDTVDIGFIAHHGGVGVNSHTGFFRSATNQEYYVFADYDPEINSNNTIDTSHATFVKANVNANYLKGNVIATTVSTVSLTSDSISTNTLSLVTPLGVSSGGTGTNSFGAGQLIIGNGTNSLQSLTNSVYTLTGTLGTSNTITGLTVDSYGRLTAASASGIAIDTSQIASGILPYARGGTGSSSYTTGGILIAGAEGFSSLANTTYTLTGSLATNNTITSVTVDAYGRLTAATGSAISGLTVPQGGTGFASATTKGIIYGNGTGALQVTAAAGAEGADQDWSSQILTVNSSGTPVWSTTLEGGTF
jgi:trimeric autotransporter adhesin